MTGTASVDVDLRSTKGGISGCLRLDVRDAKPQTDVPVVGMDASLLAQFSDRQVTMDTVLVAGADGEQSVYVASDHACAPMPEPRRGIATTRATATLALAGHPWDESSWTRATGMAELAQLDLDLAHLDKIQGWLVGVLKSPELGLPDGLTGKVSIQGTAVRPDPNSMPTWIVSARTDGVQLHLPDSDIGSVKADLVATINAIPSAVGANLCVRHGRPLRDDQPCDPNDSSVLASAALNAAFDYGQIIANPASWKDVLRDAPIGGTVIVHDRPLEALLAPFAIKTPIPVSVGNSSASIAISGTPMKPLIGYELRLARLRSNVPGWRMAVSVCSAGRYDGATGTGLVEAELRRNQRSPSNESSRRGQRSQIAAEACVPNPGGRVRSFGHVRGNFTVQWNDLLDVSSESALPWVANLETVIDDFELGEIRALEDQDISGRLRFAGRATNLGVHPTVDATVLITDLRTGSTVDYDESVLHVHSGADGTRGTLRLVDNKTGETPESYLIISADTGRIPWVNGWSLTREDSEPVNVSVNTRAFRLSILSPWLHPLFSFVDGELSGTAQRTWTPSERKSVFKQLYFSLDNGAFQIPIIGQEFIDVKGVVAASNSDRIFVESFQARSLTGLLQGWATIDLDDIGLGNLQASIHTKDKDKIRLTFGGMPIGDMSGTINVHVWPSDGRNNVDVEFAEITIDLPRTNFRNVQRLEPHEEITIAPNFSGTSTTVAVEENVTPWVVTLRTASQMVVRRYDMSFAIAMPEVDPQITNSGLVLTYPDAKTGDINLRGQIVVLEGWIDVVGNRFEIEENSAWLLFHGDATAPQIIATANYKAQDGTRVFADVTGPLADPRILFRSDPPMSQTEILSLILFGPSTQGGGAMASGSTEEEGATMGEASASVGAGAASAGVNMVLQDLIPAASTRVDTSRGQATSATLAVQVSRTLIAELSYVIEEPTLENADRFFAAIDWRFFPKWSLRVTRGDVGTSILDAIWQHRY